MSRLCRCICRELPPTESEYMLPPETGFNVIPPDVAWEVVQVLWQKVGCYAVWLFIAPAWLTQWKRYRTDFP